MPLLNDSLADKLHFRFVDRNDGRLTVLENQRQKHPPLLDPKAG